MPEKTNNVKKIGVISDTHIPARAACLPAAVSGHFTGVDLIIHCGDIVSPEVLLELGLIAPVYAVRGNMDPYELNLAQELVFEVNNRHNICVTHGSGSPNGLKNRLYKKFMAANPSIILYGHSHVPENTVYNGLTFFNPGSCTTGVRKNSIGILSVNDAGISGSIITL